jgi:hypothetical protein
LAVGKQSWGELNTQLSREGGLVEISVSEQKDVNLE